MQSNRKLSSLGAHREYVHKLASCVWREDRCSPMGGEDLGENQESDGIHQEMCRLRPRMGTRRIFDVIMLPILNSWAQPHNDAL